MRWQDGVPLTSADLWFTWRAVMNPANNVINTTGWREIASIDHRDPLVAVVHLRRKYAAYLPTFWATSGNAPILPYHLLGALNDARGSLNTAAYNAKPVGSGPFKVVSWDRGSEVRLSANDDFYLGKPSLREIAYHTLYDQNTMLAQMQTHELDLVTYASQDKWDEYRAIAGVRTIAVPEFAWRHLDFNMRDPLFADVRLRAALAQAIDRAGLVKEMLHGLGDLAEADQSPVVSWAYTPNVAHHPFDPSAARAALDALGWKPGPDGIRVRDGTRLAFTFSTTTEETLRRVQQTVIQQQWRNVGVDAEIKNYPASILFKNGPGGILREGHYQVALYDWFAGADPDHRNFYASDAMPPHGNDIPFWSDPAVDAAFDRAAATYDTAQRKAAFGDVQREIAQQLPTIVLFYERVVFAYNTDLQHFSPAPAQTYWNPWQLKI
jgi:peptide/nickel transport system substrate-binding protein